MDWNCDASLEVGQSSVAKSKLAGAAAGSFLTPVRSGCCGPHPGVLNKIATFEATHIIVAREYFHSTTTSPIPVTASQSLST